jgi:hypothetical protein
MAFTAFVFDSASGAFAGLGGAPSGSGLTFAAPRDLLDPECRTKLLPDAATCPGCGGTISGRIKSADDRLEAEERLADGAAGPPPR